MTLEPGVLILGVGGAFSARADYWDAIERLRPGQYSPDGFCLASEMRRPARSAYSKMSDGLVLVMDHDCPWIAGTVGAGNHRAFILMGLVGQGTLILCTALSLQAPPPAGFASWSTAAASALGPEAAAAQLVIGSFVTSLVLYVLLVPIVVTQVVRALPARHRLRLATLAPRGMGELVASCPPRTGSIVPFSLRPVFLRADRRAGCLSVLLRGDQRDDARAD